MCGGEVDENRCVVGDVWVQVSEREKCSRQMCEGYGESHVIWAGVCGK